MVRARLRDGAARETREVWEENSERVARDFRAG